MASATDKGRGEPGEEEDEDDYMSDALLRKLEETSAPKSTKAHRVFQAPPARNRRVDAETVLSEGMAQPIPESNIGHQLLSRMGYTKSENAPQEPIETFMRKTRAGLGVEETIRKQMRVAKEIEGERAEQAKHDAALLRESYMHQRGQQFEARKLKSQLAKIRKAEVTLREMLNLPTAAETQEVSDPAELDLDGDMDNNDPEEPQIAESEQSSSIEKPDVQEEDEVEGDLPSVKPLRQVQIATGVLEEPDYAELLERKVLELRSMPFFYCYYCGHRYENQEDLEANCPGVTEDDHA